MGKSSNFSEKLREEILRTQESRGNFVHQKLTFITSLLGIGSISIGGPVETSLLLYIAPIIAIVFDLYILGNDFNIKRAGSFLSRQESGASAEEIQWETWVNENRDPLARMAAPLLSLLVLIVSSIILLSKTDITYVFWVWSFLTLLSILGLHAYGFSLNKKIRLQIS